MSEFKAPEYYYEILLTTGVSVNFTYQYFEELAIGQIVLVPFRRDHSLGVVRKKISEKPSYELKPILKHYNFQLSAEILVFLDAVAAYNLIANGLVLKMILSPKQALLEEKFEFLYELDNPELVKLTPKRASLISFLAAEKSANYNLIQERLNISKAICRDLLQKGVLKQVKQQIEYDYVAKNYNYNAPCFNPEQQESLKILAQEIQPRKFNVALLNGVTGSGKTEIYLKLIADFLAKTSGQIVLLLPEIILTKQFIDKFTERFGQKPDFFHSLASVKSKKQIWHGAITGKARIVIGARSALFLPFKNLELIVIDEEHDSSYKQEENGCYHARDMAILRAKMGSFPVVLASATPSIETIHNCNLGKYSEVRLASRFNAADMPEIKMLDMKQEIMARGHFICDSLRKEIKSKLAKSEQVLLYLNRLGYAPLVICSGCGFRFACENCDSWLVEHKKKNALLCHHCGYCVPKKTNCPKCDAEKLVSYGPGVERIANEVAEIFPGVKSQIITSEMISKPQELQEIINAIRANEIQIIIGTQIMAKGHDFPNLTLVGVIDGDASNTENFRAEEKMFQSLQQVSGRAGRAEKKGEVLVQTYSPKKKFFHYLKEHNYMAFAQEELKRREIAKVPPYTRLASLLFSSPFERETKDYAEAIKRSLPKYTDIAIFGPVASELAYLRKKYRFRLNFRTDAANILQKYLRKYLLSQKLSNKVRIKVDIDPQNFY